MHALELSLSLSLSLSRTHTHNIRSINSLDAASMPNKITKHRAHARTHTHKHAHAQTEREREREREREKERKREREREGGREMSTSLSRCTNSILTASSSFRLSFSLSSPPPVCSSTQPVLESEGERPPVFNSGNALEPPLMEYCIILNKRSHSAGAII